MRKAPKGPRHGARRRLLLAGVLLAGVAVLVRSFQLQALDSTLWRGRAEDEHADRMVLPAPRGTVYDRNGVPLAASAEAFRVAVAPRELRDRASAEARLRAALNLGVAEVRRAIDRRPRWVVLPGLYDAAAKGRLEGLRGVYFEGVVRRFYPHGPLARDLIGPVTADGKALGGLELEFDSLLSGTPGYAVVRRDAHGRTIPGAMLSAVQPVPGNDLYLTIDAGLQDIAREALAQAVDSTGAAGGDLIMADPYTGEILAAVSLRSAGATHWRAATDTYEPGSTFKPFLVATLLATHRATLADRVYAEEGRYTYAGRTVSDVEPNGWLTLRDALRVSSNISMVKMSSRLDPEQQYRYLRDFGFGSPTGVRYPSESTGTLRPPSRWSRYSQGSLAIGYEVGVTPLQMALAYGAIANGGMLMEPRLVREVRSRDGRTIEAFGAREVRRVIPARIAASLREVLAEVVEDGTGTRAGLGPFPVAGKTGTARVFRAGHYERGAYTASFAGFFPVQDPQLVFLVKIDRPQHAIYGGLAAAPVTRATLAAALAAWHTPLDRAAVARSATPARAGDRGGADAATAPGPAAAAAAPAGGPYVFALNGGRARRAGAAAPSSRTVPAVTGLPLRDAARRLLADGFRVQVDGTGAVEASDPEAGTVATSGTLVHLRGAGGGDE